GGTAQNGCGNGNPVAAPGFAVVPFATGFSSGNFTYQGIAFNGCPGAYGIAFDATGNLYVAHEPTGNIYKFDQSGGIAGGGTLLSAVPMGPSWEGWAFDARGNLYAARAATTSTTTGAVLQIDSTTGAVIRTVTSAITCPSGVAIDPVSGDLFTTNSCT